jgi:transcriptional regulator with XRE-family HTH domain
MIDREDLLKTLSVRLRQARQAMEPPLTQRDVAKAFGVSNSAVNLWETGNAFPKHEHLVNLAAWFSVSVDWLLGIDNTHGKRMRMEARSDRKHFTHAEGTAETVEAMVKTLRQQADALVVLAHRIREEEDVSLASDAARAIGNCFGSLRLDLLVSRPLRAVERATGRTSMDASAM